MRKWCRALRHDHGAKVRLMSPDHSPLPVQLGCRTPAEWEPHAATWLAWPHKEESWPGKFAPIPDIWVRMIAELVEGETVRLLVNDEDMEADARNRLAAANVPTERVLFHHIPTNDTWIRDYGPMFVVRDGKLALNNWHYNAWGGKYPPWDDDDRVKERIAQRFGYPLHETGIILEGGSVDVNGCGTLLTTEACLLNPNRNPQLSKSEIEEILKDYLGVTRILWLGDGIVGDDTDGHIDDLARFVNETTVVTVLEDDPSDENYEPLQENLRRLRGMTDQDGKALNILTLPMPEPIYCDGQRLPASYANFYVANECVLLPVFGQPSDERAIEILRDCFPTRRIAPIDAVDLVWGLGACHCVTQQEPAV